jgi:hypothetical protein
MFLTVNPNEFKQLAQVRHLVKASKWRRGFFISSVAKTAQNPETSQMPPEFPANPQVSVF